MVLWKAEQRDVWWVAQLVEKTGDQMVVLRDSAKVDHWGELKVGCLVERLVVHLVLSKVGWKEAKWVVWLDVKMVGK